MWIVGGLFMIIIYDYDVFIDEYGVFFFKLFVVMDYCFWYYIKGENCILVMDEILFDSSEYDKLM